jgi:hypothetical protein
LRISKHETESQRFFLPFSCPITARSIADPDVCEDCGPRSAIPLGGAQTSPPPGWCLGVSGVNIRGISGVFRIWLP